MKDGNSGDPNVSDTSRSDDQLERIKAELRETQARLRDALGLLAEAERSVRASKEQTVLLEGELQHRVRNMLAVVRSVFSRTVATRSSLEDASDHFKGRLDALARYQAGPAMLSYPYHDLENMLREEFLQVGFEHDPRIRIAGPEAILTGKVAESVGLALHELVTNSIKFGILAPGNDKGGLVVEWHHAGARLHFRWNESGVAIVSSAPLHRGFGREFVEDSLPYQLGAVTSVEIAPGRITCIMNLPLSLDGEDGYKTRLGG